MRARPGDPSLPKVADMDGLSTWGGAGVWALRAEPPTGSGSSGRVTQPPRASLPVDLVAPGTDEPHGDPPEGRASSDEDGFGAGRGCGARVSAPEPKAEAACSPSIRRIVSTTRAAVVL